MTACAVPSDLGLSNLRSADLGSPDLRSPDLGPPDLRSSDLGPPDLRSPDLGLPDLRSADLGSPQPGAARGVGGSAGSDSPRWTRRTCSKRSTPSRSDRT